MGAVILKLSGVICTNFGCNRGLGLGACASAWPGKCCTQDNFPVLHIMKDLDDAILSEEDLEEDDPFRFWEACNGDYLLTSFQCDVCHSQNVKQQNLVELNHQDCLFMTCIR